MLKLCACVSVCNVDRQATNDNHTIHVDTIKILRLCVCVYVAASYYTYCVNILYCHKLASNVFPITKGGHQRPF